MLLAPYLLQTEHVASSPNRESASAWTSASPIPSSPVAPRRGHDCFAYCAARWRWSWGWSSSVRSRRVPSAQEGPIQNPPPGSFVESWALAPTGLDPSQPSSRPNITASLAPGATQQDSVSLWNYSDVPLTFHVLRD